MSFDSETCLELFKYHFVCWLRNAWGAYVPSMTDIFQSPAKVELHQHKKASRPNVSWFSPSQSMIKINVDGSFSFRNGSSGIGGVFKDSFGTFILHLENKMDVNSTIHAEILAIRERLLITVASRWSGSTRFVNESDSFNVVTWFLDPDSAP